MHHLGCALHLGWLFICCFSWVDVSVETEFEDPGEYHYEDPATCSAEEPTGKMIVPGSQYYLCSLVSRSYRYNCASYHISFSNVKYHFLRP